MGLIGAKITHVIPAKAGIHLQATRTPLKKSWMPACAGMTIGRGVKLPGFVMP